MIGSPIRLRKAASDFNVGTATIIEFLNKKGFALEDNPNTKIPEDLYVLLVSEFSKDRATKMDADKISIGNKKETISLDDKPKKQKDEENGWDKEENINIKSRLINDFNTKSETVEKPKPVVKKEEEVAPKETTKTETKSAKKEVVVENKKPEKETKEVKKTEQKVEEPSEKQSKIGVKVVGVMDLDALKPQKDKNAEKDNKPVEEKQEKSDISVQETEVKKVVEESKQEEKKIQVEEKKETVIEKKEVEIKVEQQPVEKKEEKKEQKHQTPVKTEKVVVTEHHHKEQQKELKKEVKEIQPESTLIPTEYEKLTGPTVVGKIDLSQFEKKPKKPVASSSNDINKQNRKKRKRIKEGGSGATQPNGTKKPFDPNYKPKEGGFKKDANATTTNKDRPKPDFNKDRDKKKKPKKKEVIKVELTEEEIQKQVRETLSKLTASSKSKGSKHRREKRDLAHKHLAEKQRQAEENEKVLKVTEFLTANELATMMNVPVNKIIAMCMSLGLFVSINQRLGAETISIVAEENGFQVEFIDHSQESEEVEKTDSTEELASRQPIVTVMGHVDHGKTKLLDYIRRTNVVAGEAGGITQHIGAYSVQLDDGRKITFLDTPGHEAFTAMRARGAKLTDIVIIVIAADDAVMPQTKEAINHAQAAGVPIVFAINKIDKPGADPERVRTELSQMNILVEEWGGKYQSQEISAKQGINIDKLLEKVLLEAEILELKANPNRLAKGTVIESKLEHGRGYVSSILVENGTLHKGDIVLCGSYYGRVKAMFNEREQPLNEAGPATPVLMVGLNGAPQAGDTFTVYEDESEAKKAAIKRQQLQREMGIRTKKHITLDEIGRRIAIGDFKELNIIVKADVDGSVEALSDSLLKLSTEEVQVNVIHKGVGAIIESDVVLASASDAIIIGFQVRPISGAKKLAEAENIDIRIYSIIYEAIEELQSAIEGMLSPTIKEEITCNVEVREIFKISKVGTIAGCFVLEGNLTRDTKIRVIRDGIVIYNGALGSLKRFKDDVKEAKAGQECGLNITSFNDIQVGDIIEGYKETEVKRKLK